MASYARFESDMELRSGKEEVRVGITLITGFLGSGKSTLIRRVLTEKHNLRLVVIENEFGPTASVEKAIVTQGVGPGALDEFIELPNGCICCAAQDDLVDALTRLVEQKRGKFDHILIEASGLADPRPVAASLWVDDVVDASLRLDAVVAVVDAANIEQVLAGRSNMDKDIALKQLAVADIILLNKIDLIAQRGEQSDKVECGKDTGATEQLSSILRGYGCLARIIPTLRCDVDLHELLNIRAYENSTTVDALSKIVPEKFKHHGHVDDSERASTFTLEFTGKAFSANLLTRALGELLWEQSNDDGETQQQIWRMKALVVIETEPFKRIYQSVHTLFDDMVSNEKVEGGNANSLFLFIGKNMDEQLVKDSLSRAVISNAGGDYDDGGVGVDSVSSSDRVH